MTTVVVSPGRTRARFSQASSSLIPPLVLGLAAIGIWWVAAALSDSTVFPTPGEAVESLINDLQDGRFRDSIVQTLKVLFVAFIAAVGIGGLLGMLLGLKPFRSAVVLPVVYGLNSIPKIVLYPIYLLFLGLGNLSRGAFAFTSGVLFMFLVSAEAAAGVQRLHLKLAGTLGLGWLSTLRRIVIPSVLPSLASGMRTAFGLTFLGLVLAEMLSGSSGIGYELFRNIALVRMENILGLVILVMLLALIPTLILQRIEQHVQRRYTEGAS